MGFLPIQDFIQTGISGYFPQWYQALNRNPLGAEERPVAAVRMRHETLRLPVLRRLEGQGNWLIDHPLHAFCSSGRCERIVNGQQIDIDGSPLARYGSVWVSEAFAGFLVRSGVLADAHPG